MNQVKSSHLKLQVLPDGKYGKLYFMEGVCERVVYDMDVTLQSVELMECTGEEFLPWVAQYLVMKRASIEHNFHTLYSNFIDHLKKPEFLTVVIAETYRNIKVPALS